MDILLESRPQLYKPASEHDEEVEQPHDLFNKLNQLTKLLVSGGVEVEQITEAVKVFLQCTRQLSPDHLFTLLQEQIQAGKLNLGTVHFIHSMVPGYGGYTLTTPEYETITALVSSLRPSIRRDAVM